MNKAYGLFLLFALSFSSSALAEGIKIIVNENNPVASVTTSQLRDYFLKKNKQWPNGSAVRFFDRGDDSKERKIFLRDIVRRSHREIESFWIGQKLYTGLSAPTQVNSDSMAALMVSRFPGAIGYVSSDFSGGKGIKFLDIKEE